LAVLWPTQYREPGVDNAGHNSTAHTPRSFWAALDARMFADEIRRGGVVVGFRWKRAGCRAGRRLAVVQAELVGKFPGKHPRQIHPQHPELAPVRREIAALASRELHELALLAYGSPLIE
jgi:hypothetical protein